MGMKTTNQFAVFRPDESQWDFITPTNAKFPDDFLAFDTSDDPDNRYVVYVTDTTQACVAYDYLIEHGWAYFF